MSLCQLLALISINVILIIIERNEGLTRRWDEMTKQITKENEITIVDTNGTLTHVKSEELMGKLKAYWGTDDITHVLIDTQFLGISASVNGGPSYYGSGALDEDFKMALSDLGYDKNKNGTQKFDASNRDHKIDQFVFEGELEWFDIDDVPAFDIRGERFVVDSEERGMIYATMHGENFYWDNSSERHISDAWRWAVVGGN